jgi:dTDP-4-amino-4,6-dideoxygalactose transaminase
VHYPVPCHQQPPYVDFAEGAGTGGALPVAEAAAVRILSLPVSPTITAEQVDRVGEVLAHAENDRAGE